MSNLPSARVIQEQLDAALADYEKQRSKLKDFQNDKDEASTVTHSKDRMLTMTFNGQGELAKMTINNEKYRTMAPAQLATVFQETLAAGRAQAIERIGDLFGGQLPGGVSFAELASGKADLTGILDAIIGPAMDMLPSDALTPSEQARLRPGA